MHTHATANGESRLDFRPHKSMNIFPHTICMTLPAHVMINTGQDTKSHTSGAP